MSADAQVLRVGNCSGFYGDRLSAMREMLTGGELDVLTGDYLAELTMLILGRDRIKDPAAGFARTFLSQAEDCLGLALERGVKLVANAGGLNPAGLADRLRQVAAGLGLSACIAHVEGDDLLDRAGELGIAGTPLTANAYLGGSGIAAALVRGADVVVTGRVTDASLVLGPAVARFGWPATAYDQLAGAVVAGHVIECGTQATGGNFSGFRPEDRPLGFPVAEVHSDGSCVITKHPGTGGRVSVDTVTAQLVYEIGSPTYLNPDVCAHLDTLSLSTDSPDRVRISGVRGSPPPSTLKVCVNELGGWRGCAELVLVGLDIEKKAAWVQAQVTAALGSSPPAHVEWSLARTDHQDADTEEAASLPTPGHRARPVGRPGRQGVHRPPGRAGPRVVPRLHPHRPARAPHAVRRVPCRLRRPRRGARTSRPGRDHAGPGVAATAEQQTSDGRRAAEGAGLWPGHGGRARNERAGVPAASAGRSPSPGIPRRIPLGRILHARSGDKGGDANVGVWAMDAARRPDRVQWLLDFLTVDRVRALLPETASLDVEVHALPNLGAVNVVIHGLLGEGVAASTRFDPQAKALGEWLRSRHADVPEALL